MLERILALIKENGLSSSQFADEIGIQRSGMSHLISGRNKPSLDFILKIMERFPDTDLSWLIRGTERNDTQAENGTTDTGPTQSTLFDGPGIPEISIQQKAERRKVKGELEKSVEKIIVLYSDRSFREYNPD